MEQSLTTLLLLALSLAFGQANAQTVSQKKQVQTIITHLKSNNGYPVGAKDTMIDVNGDGFKDLLIEYYGQSGTGLKNRVTVYLYDNVGKRFKPNEQLNALANPSFYFDKKVVVGYYIANGGGDATKLKWNGLKLDTLEHIDVEIDWPNNTPAFTLTSYNYLTKKKNIKTLQAMDLPKEYNYWKYQPIIRSESR